MRPARMEQVAGGTGSGRDTTGGQAAGGRAAGRQAAGGRAAARPGAATGVGTAGARLAGTHARQNPAAELGFSGDPGQHGDPGDDMLHAQRIWDGTLATNRLDDLGVNAERQRLETKDVTVSVSLLADGWPDDVAKSVQSLIDHTHARVLALDLGNIDGAGDVLDELADRHPERIAVWHVAERPHWRGGTATWGESRAKLLRLDESSVHVLMETDVVLRGDALTPLVAAVIEGAVAAGWHGLEPVEGEGQDAPAAWQPDHSQNGGTTPAGGHPQNGGTTPAGGHPQDGGTTPASGDARARWRVAGPGKVRALGGELMAVRRATALGALPEDAHYGGNADLEFSLALGGDLVVPGKTLPVTRLGPHEVAPDYRARECGRNYAGVLRRLRDS
ncbi:hypothetical protein [Nonomuraea sp. NPDC002799]